MSLYHVKTQTVPDSTATSLVRPSDWNSAHAQALTLSGNTAGQSTVSGTNIVFQGGNNMTLSAQTAAGAATVILSAGMGGGGGVALSAGTNSTSTGTVAFADSNGISFGMNTNGVVTGTVKTDYLTTAALSNHSHNFATTTTNGSQIVVGTTNSAGATIGVPPFITTFQNDLTSGRAGTGFTSTTTAGTAVVGTLNTNGLSLGVPTIVTNALTTAAQSNHSHNLATTTTNGSQIVIATTNSNGATMAVPPFITTYVNDLTSGRAGTGFTSTTTAGTAVVGTLNTNGLSIGVPTIITNAITTARASNDGVGLNTAGSNVTWTVNSAGLSLDARGYAGTGTTFNGTNVSGSITQNSNGLRLDLSVGAGGAADGYNSAQFTNSTANSTMPLVWAGNSNGSGNVTVGLTGSTITMSAPLGGGGGAALQGSGTYTQNTGTVQFANSNGLTFGLSNNGVMTASHNGLTTARASNDAVGLNTAATNVTWTVNSGGISLNAGAYLTTARASNDAVGLNTALTAGPLAWTVNSGGISLNAGSAAGTSTGFAGNLISGSMTHNTAGLNISLNHPAWLTTAAQSNHSHGNPTLALTNITGTTASASNGLTLSLSGVAAQTTQTQPAGNIAGVGTTFAGTNVSGSMTLNSNGLNLALSAPTPGGGGAINVSAGTTSGNLQTIQFNNANGVSFGLNGSTVTASVNTAQDFWSLQGNTAGTNAYTWTNDGLYLAGGNNITLSGNGSTITIVGAAGGGGGGVTEDNWFPHRDALWAVHQIGQNSIQVQPMAGVPVFSYDRMAYGVQFSGATNSTMTVSATVHIGFYTLNGSTLSLLTSGSGSFSINGSGTANSTINSGPRWASMTLNGGGTVGGDDIWVAFRSSTATAGVNATLSNIVASRINSTWSGFIGVGTANSVQSLPGMGFYSATSSALPNSMALSHITGNSSTAQRPQVFWMTNGPVPN